MKIDSNEDQIEIINPENEQRKPTNIPTLMITVKNEMAQSINEQTILNNGKFKFLFLFVLIYY